MTVRELIEELKKLPQDADVNLYVYGEQKEAERVVYGECVLWGLFPGVEIS